MSEAGRFSLRRMRTVGGGCRHQVREEVVRDRVDLVKQKRRENHGDDERQDHPDQRLDGVDQITSVVGAGGVEDHLAQRGHYGHVPLGCRNENSLRAVRQYIYITINIILRQLSHEMRLRGGNQTKKVAQW